MRAFALSIAIAALLGSVASAGQFPAPQMLWHITYQTQGYGWAVATDGEGVVWAASALSIQGFDPGTGAPVSSNYSYPNYITNRPAPLQPLSAGVVVGLGDQLVAYSTSGKLWSHVFHTNVTGSMHYAPDAGLVFAATSDGHITAVNATTGDRVWSIMANYALSAVSSPRANEAAETVAFCTNGHVYAVHLLLGTPLWHVKLNSTSCAAEVATNTIGGKGYFYALSTDGYEDLTAHMITSGGNVVWARQSQMGGYFGQNGDYPVMIATDEGFVYLATDDSQVAGTFIAYAALNGTAIWYYQYSNYGVQMPSLGPYGNLYFPDGSYVVGLGSSTGSFRFDNDLPPSSSPCQTILGPTVFYQDTSFTICKDNWLQAATVPGPSTIKIKQCSDSACSQDCVVESVTDICTSLGPWGTDVTSSSRWKSYTCNADKTELTTEYLSGTSCGVGSVSYKVSQWVGQCQINVDGTSSMLMSCP